MSENPATKFAIFSEGSLSDFESLQLPDECFYLDYSLDVTFHTMVLSNWLVMAKSSLSYCAAILNPNNIIYDPFQHAPLENWLGLTEKNTLGRFVL